MRKLVILTVLALAGAAWAQSGRQMHPMDRPSAFRPAPANAELDGQLAQVRTAAARYRDFAVAEREGWRKFAGDLPLMGEHWYLPGGQGAAYASDQAIDWSRPSNLMYTEIGGSRVLAGVTYNVRLGPGEPLPEGFAGSGDTWHVHDFGAFTGTSSGRSRLAMVHVWTGVANPDGLFAGHNRVLPYLKLGLPASHAQGGSAAAAKGLQLAAPNGCADTTDLSLSIAGAGAATRRALLTECQAAGAQVRRALPGGDKRKINAAGEQGWGRFGSAWMRALSPEQRARVAAFNEHGEGHSAHH
jgi:hypothetical protein